MAETEKYMKDNNLYNDEKENYTYLMRSNMMKLNIERIITKYFIIMETLKLDQKTLQDQFRKLRGYYDTI